MGGATKDLHNQLDELSELGSNSSEPTVTIFDLKLLICCFLFIHLVTPMED